MNEEIEIPPDAAAKRPDGKVVFEVRGLTKVYPMAEVAAHAFRGIDLELDRGEFLVLLGPSSSGKSTRLDILGELDVPSAGMVQHSGQGLTADHESELARCRRLRLDFASRFYNLMPSLTARTA